MASESRFLDDHEREPTSVGTIEVNADHAERLAGLMSQLAPFAEADLGGIPRRIDDAEIETEPEAEGQPDDSPEPIPSFFKVPERQLKDNAISFTVYAPRDERYYPSLLARRVIKLPEGGETVEKDYYTTSMSARGHANYDPEAERSLDALANDVEDYLGTSPH